MIEHFYGQGVMYTQDYWNGIMVKIPFDLLAQFLRGKKRSEKDWLLLKLVLDTMLRIIKSGFFYKVVIFK